MHGGIELRQRALWLVMLCFVVAMAGAGVHPALAFVCHPTVTGLAFAKGDALAAYMPLVQLLLGEGIDAAGIDQEQLHEALAEVGRKAPGRDIYGVTWDVSYAFGCEGSESAGLSFVKYGAWNGTLDFSPGLIDFFSSVEIPWSKNVYFTLNDERKGQDGLRIAFNRLPLAKRADGGDAFWIGAAVDVWQVSEYYRSSFTFSKPADSDVIQVIESEYRRPKPGEPTPAALPDFSGRGVAVGALIGYSPSEELEVVYTMDNLWAEERVDGLLQVRWMLNTDNEYFTIDDYLEKRPTLTGTIKVYSHTERPMPRHRVQLGLHKGFPLTVAVAYDTKDEAITELSVATSYPLGGGRIDLKADWRGGYAELGYSTRPLAVGNEGKISLHLDLRLRTDAISLDALGAAGIAGTALLRF